MASVTWGQFNQTLQHKGRAAAAKLLPQMQGEEYTAARRWLHGPTAVERRESARRQRAIEAVSARELRRHCQLDFLPRRNPSGGLMLVLVVTLVGGALLWMTSTRSGVPGGQPLLYSNLPRLIDLKQWGGNGFEFDQVNRRVFTIAEHADAGPANSIQEAIQRVHAWFGA